MLAIFGTIARYADMSGIQPADVSGIVVIDEIDAHMHMDLQLNALPKLIGLFPKVQFIMSSHSPFFPLGMETRFPNGGVRIVELPSGLSRDAEAYSELLKAVDALRGTRTFEGEVTKLLQAGETPRVLVAGKTDVPYFRTAAQLLGFSELIDAFQFIGTSENQTGQKSGDRNSGDSNLTNAVKFIQANPELTERKIIAVYDCDAKKVAVSDERVRVIKMEKLVGRKMKKGIENRIPDAAFTDEMYDKLTIDGDYGDGFEKPDFNKVRACELICGDDADIEHFRDFQPILEEIRAALTGT
ncbi:hypothetical protein B1R94_10665 [Mycolicibacterium litorale]|nr:hypothetical protein B1R94_10665 [Mycolicibacterium litorale]